MIEDLLLIEELKTLVALSIYIRQQHSLGDIPVAREALLLTL